MMKTLMKSVISRSSALWLSLLVLAACGLKLPPPLPDPETQACRHWQGEFPSSENWSSDLLGALLECSQKSDRPLGLESGSLAETAKWLNESFGPQTRDQLASFLESVPTDLAPTLQKFAKTTSAEEQKHWQEWIRWTRMAVGQKNIRTALFAEQLKSLAAAPPESVEALSALLLKLRAATSAERQMVFERLGKIFADFVDDRPLQNFLIKGVTPLKCLQFEADRVDTSLISSGWLLLLRTQQNPVAFGKTFLQSYGLLQNFCQVSEIPSHTETKAALDYFVAHHEEIFVPILKHTDPSTRALVPLMRLWSQSELGFSQSEFVALLDTLNQILEASKSSDPSAFAAYVRVLSQWASGLARKDIVAEIKKFRSIPWDLFVVPAHVLTEWTESAEQSQSPLLEVLAAYIGKNSHHRMAALLRVIKWRDPSIKAPAAPPPLRMPPETSIADALARFMDAPSTNPLPKNAAFLKCLEEPEALGLWICLKTQKEPSPFEVEFLNHERHSPLFFAMRDPAQPGRWLGQGFFSPTALPLWQNGLKKLRGLKLPIGDFVSEFPMGDLNSDERVQATYTWLQSAPQTQPEASHFRIELGIPARLSVNDFDTRVWKKWFDDPAYWVAVQKLLLDPARGPKLVRGLKDLTRKKIRLELYKSDEDGLARTSAGDVGMLSALDLLLWEVPYDWIREMIIGKILNSTSPADLKSVLEDSKSQIHMALTTLDLNPITRHGKLWKKTKNAQTILDATIAMKIENELFNWAEMMRALSAGLSDGEAKDFLVTLQKSGIISSISHLLHEQNPTASQFGTSLIEVFHMIRNAKADRRAWFNAIWENQRNHGLFVYQILGLSFEAAKDPSTYYHLNQMNALVKVGASWIRREPRLLPLKEAFDAVTGPDTVFNPWVWLFLREIQDTSSPFHEPWMRLLVSLQKPAARRELENWIDSGIPQNIGAWMDAIILTPSPRF